MGIYTVIPQNTFEQIQLDAGILLSSFDPASPAVVDANIICATSGGIKIDCIPQFEDLGEDVDNCPINMKELKRITGYDCKISFTGLSTSLSAIKMAVGAATLDSTNHKITPKLDLVAADFANVWWVGDKSDGGFVAVKLLNALSTGGFSLQTTKDGKGNITIELTGHVSINSQSVMPMEIYSIDSAKTVTYDANGGTGTMTDSSSPYAHGSTVTVKANAFTAPTGKTFDAWNTVADGTGTEYDADETFTITSNVTLYAQWTTA